MKNLYQKLYKSSPHSLANLLIGFYNVRQYKIRHGGAYQAFRKYYEETEKLSLEDAKKEQLRRLRSFLRYTYEHSKYYHEKWRNLHLDFKHLEWEEFKQLPFMTKEELQKNIKDVCTINRRTAVSFQTGGTTGVSLQVYYTPHNIQERFAMVDHFRSRFGFEFGEKTAWFTGKDLLNSRDASKHRYWRTDRQNNIRFYSTYHLQQKNFNYYIDNFNKYQPAYFSGATSSLSEIAKGGLKAGIKLTYHPKAVFPTAEMLLKEDREAMETFYGCGVYDQYASSEGAPFITQCRNAHMHMELMTGVFEVLNCHQQPTDFGELIVTSFTTEGTPLVRYRIGDMVEMETKPIDCYLKYPIVKSIHGRLSDCVYSRETGKICQGNLVNSVKNIKGITRFQIVQNELDAILVKIVKADEYIKATEEPKLLKELRIRLGKEMDIQFNYVDEIPRERSGKYRIIKNNCNEEI
ncbi:phenylacetate--CoA ligase family protein [Prolixibacter denitrificans]|uniref:Adenylyltransferase n=1 Tax=Prolixibacter denitrificans TaxID=1541063 RepID=A0A2P8CDR0_9BACT|nr:phenylacetate--CoA ligase family protein [Prolixibacter denitrificans]PSK83127.1 phenylacetate-CoA ligase [Prolixibacter denitrificans]GET21990.1 adenylyltransferase [Prolixibacter denitrificans]